MKGNRVPPVVLIPSVFLKLDMGGIMRSLFRRLGVSLIVGVLSLSGVASAMGVAAVHNLWGEAGAGAIASDGTLFGWGVVGGMNQYTTPTQFNQNVAAVSQNGEFIVFKDGTLFEMQNYSPVAGASAVKAVIEPANNQLMGMQGPAWYIHDKGNGSNGAKSFMNIANGFGGVQTLIGPGFGLSGSVASAVPRGTDGANGASWAWATDITGQLYDVQSIYTWGAPGSISNVVVPITGMSNVVAVAEHYQTASTFVARTDGTVWAWGMNIGPDGSFNNPYGWNLPVAGVSGVSAVQVTGAANVVSLAVGRFSVYALTATGQVYAWGNDSYGQLGQGYNNWGMDQALPVLVPGLNNIVLIRPFGGSVLALDSNGDVWAWGDNYWGQLGLGNSINTPQPTKVPGLSGVTSLSAMSALNNMAMGIPMSGAYALASKSDGSVWAWGDNSTGQLGNGSRTSSNVPVRVLGQFGIGFMNVEPAVLDVLVGGVSVMGNSPWNGFDFGTQAINTTSAPQSMTFSNIGMVSWTGFTFGALSSEFAQNNNCGVTLLPGASCTVNFTFTPTLAGVRKASLMGGFNIGNSNLGGAGGPTLTGTGVAPLAVMSTALGFGTQKTAFTTSRTVSLSNTGNAALTVGTPGVTGAGFSLGATTCGATLAAGTSCTLNVNFAPVAVVAYTGNLTFVGSNNPGGAPVMALSGSGAAAATTRGDFDGNGMADILWRDLTTGQNAIWLMNSAAIASGAALYTVPPEWEVAGISDFTGDVKSDILWRNSLTGSNALWAMNGAAIASGNILSSASAEWKIASVADFNGDGLVNDILWFNPVTRQGAIWLTNAGVVSSAAFLGSVATGWQIGGVGDFDGDGKSDILWRNQLTGANILWYINGVALQGYAAVSSVPSSYSVAGVADFNGDAKADILWRDAAGNNAVWLMNGSAIASAAVIPSVPSPLWSLSRTVDYNGDGKADILWRDTSGNNAMWLMNGTTLSSGLTVPSVPANWTSVNK